MSAKVTEKAYQLEESDITERKPFLRSFIKRIEIDEDKATLHYQLPLPNNENRKVAAEVLPIDTPSGDRGIRTPDLRDANAALSQLSYIPMTSGLL